jgi:hypothetical protein
VKNELGSDQPLEGQKPAERLAYRPPSLEPLRAWHAATGISLPIGLFQDLEESE